MLAQHSLASDFNRMLSNSGSDELDLLDPDPDIAADSDVTAMIREVINEVPSGVHVPNHPSKQQGFERVLQHRNAWGRIQRQWQRKQRKRQLMKGESKRSRRKRMHEQ
jgi:hypothetical protein